MREYFLFCFTMARWKEEMRRRQRRRKKSLKVSKGFSVARAAHPPTSFGLLSFPNNILIKSKYTRTWACAWVRVCSVCELRPVAARKDWNENEIWNVCTNCFHLNVFMNSHTPFGYGLHRFICRELSSSRRASAERVPQFTRSQNYK